MSTTTPTARTADRAAKRAEALAFVNNPLREVLRIAGVVDGMLSRGSYGSATVEFIEGNDRLTPKDANLLYEWLLTQIQTAVLNVAVLAEADDDHALDIPLECLASYRCMYLGCYGSDIGFTRTLLRTADSLRLDNDLYAALLLFSITMGKREES